MSNVQSYPLAWPPGFPRTPAHSRSKGQFKTGYSDALKHVTHSLRLFGSDSGKTIVDPVLSSNTDMLGHTKDGDAGVAVWFTWDGMQICIPCDRYATAAANLQAIHHILEARRVELRHGSLNLIRATFAGFKALPAPARWQDVLNLPTNSTKEAVDTQYRSLAKECHNAGGFDADMARLNHARDTAYKELGIK